MKTSNHQHQIFSWIKSSAKNETGVTLRLTSGMIGKVLMKLIFTGCKYAQGVCILIIQEYKIIKGSAIQSNTGGFLGRLPKSLIKVDLPLMRSLLTPLAKMVLIPLGLTVTASPADAGIQKKSYNLEQQH